MAREITLQLTVTVPDDTEGLAVENAINAALDENGLNDWGDWIVGAVTITAVDDAEV